MTGPQPERARDPMEGGYPMDGAAAIGPGPGPGDEAASAGSVNVRAREAIARAGQASATPGAATGAVDRRRLAAWPSRDDHETD